MDLKEIDTSKLLEEISRRGALRCSCGKWAAYLGVWDADGYTLRCRGCLKSIHKCRC